MFSSANYTQARVYAWQEERRLDRGVSALNGDIRGAKKRLLETMGFLEGRTMGSFYMTFVIADK